jgi:hypothetical protein
MILLIYIYIYIYIIYCWLLDGSRNKIERRDERKCKRRQLYFYFCEGV